MVSIGSQGISLPPRNTTVEALALLSALLSLIRLVLLEKIGARSSP